MMLNRKAITGKPRSGWLRSAGALLVAAASAVTLVAGCLDRPVVKQDPKTSNVYVAEIRQTAVDKIDLLFMIDNSISMADKQAILGDAVGSLANRLVTPICVNAQGQPTGGSTDANGNCQNGSPEFTPIKDIHIGVVSSSLGAHGGQTCADAAGDDKGQLVPLVRQDAMYPFTTWNNNMSGFLYWDPRGRATPPGQGNVMQLQQDFRNMVLAVGQTGCGFESTLEGWYRFLIDPQPILNTPAVTDASQVTKPNYNNDVNTNPVLQQRAKFLRPDSLVAIIMLSDENDCSIVDEGQGWLVGQQTLNGQSFRMPRSTQVCATNPNDKCCASCLATSSASGCGNIADDPSCKAGTFYPAPEDALNLRCYKQKQRFGFDLLYPLSRYVDGLYESEIENRDRQKVANPLFVAGPGSVPRDKSLVFLAGIVGVPWQDIAVDPNAAALQYKPYKGIDWNMLLGTPGDATTPPQPPGDKLMFETVQDRTQIWQNAPHPVIGAAGALAPSTATGRPNAINGHEVNIKKNDDLQYACIFQLPSSRPNCTGAGCDCDADGQDYNRPLCDGSTQVYAKAYPGVRELQVLKDFGAKGTQNSIVASICPKTLGGSKTDPSYGYNPAVSAIIERLKEALKGKCLPRQLVPDPDNENKVPCAVIESMPPPDGGCSCDVNAGRTEPSAEIRPAVYKQLSDNGNCGNKEGQIPCDSFCLCEIQQFSGDNLRTCQTAPTPPGGITPGYCYVDPSTAMGADQEAQNAIVASCPATQKRLLRFVGDNTPAKGAIAMIACLGATAFPQQMQ
ncbi:MAG: hypothetical protein ACOY0T_25190 [Myxococcota bacterium]